MSALFHRLQPTKKFRISIGAIAQLLKIPKRWIVRVESWAYVVFVHRCDKGGQFISYRQLQQWQSAVAYQLQNCSTCQQLQQLWHLITDDFKKHKKQYYDNNYSFLCQFYTKRFSCFLGEQELAHSTISFSCLIDDPVPY